ncbi:tRNA (adenosine(37)-N6)-threonylcarbamoyltransferase complex ATPase subunit type 1 TsaE [bacterium]|nr:tRNA (adenosine(37)-N6)-threonylcarbamoyltransferase complex ATPase subunit type 1 TsaE [bacterium]
MKSEFITKNSKQTRKLGEILGKEVLKTLPKKKALVFGLLGDLGGGKTTFLKGFAKGLGIKEKILSPTFILMKKFQIPNSKTQIPKFKYFYHIDCYRIQKPQEILSLGFKKIIFDSQNVVAIEWADRILKKMPKGTVWISFEFLDKDKRKITVSNTKSKKWK